MPKKKKRLVKLGSPWGKEFDVDSEEIDASRWGVSDADCVAFAARMTTGEINRVKRLILVRFIVFHMQNSRLPFSSAFVRANMSFAGQQPSRRRGSDGACCRSASEQQRADAKPCKMDFGAVLHLQSSRLLFHRRL
jgi:hypothetical protein